MNYVQLIFPGEAKKFPMVFLPTDPPLVTTLLDTRNTDGGKINFLNLLKSKSDKKR